MIYFLNVGNKDSVVTSTANDNELLSFIKLPAKVRYRVSGVSGVPHLGGC